MGHLINPTGYHVGYFSNWVDIWSTSNHFVYAELLHNSLDCRRILSFYFENFVTDKYSILYSHFTYETSNLNTALIKMYFYDGIVEQKVEHLVQQMRNFNKAKSFSHKRIMRRFRLVKDRLSRANFLNAWRYYEYALSKKIIFFFIYLLNLNPVPYLTDFSRKFIMFVFKKSFEKRWHFFQRRCSKPTVFSFVRYYLRFLVARAFSKKTKLNRKLHGRKERKSSLSLFLKSLDKILYFWRKRHNFFREIVFKCKIFYKYRFKRHLSFLKKADRLSLNFFTSFYRVYLMRFRQACFFRFMNVIVAPIINRVGVVKTGLEFFGIDNDTVTAIFLARYISRKIEMRFQINKELFTPIGRDLRYLMKNTAVLSGYKIQFTGRLTRRDRVRTTWTMSGKMPLTSMEAQIEHSFSLGILRNGICCLRVWLYRHKSFGNYNYNYKYKLKI